VSPQQRSPWPNLHTVLTTAVVFALLGGANTHAWVVEQKSTVNFNDYEEYAGIPYTLVTVPVMDISPSIPYGGIVGGVGLYAGAGGHANVDVRLETWFDNSFDLAAKGNQHTFIFSPQPDPYVGDSFFLYNSIDSLGIQKLNLESGNLFAEASLDVDVGGWAKAEACLGFCVSAGLKLNVGTVVELAQVSNSGLSVFGETVDGSPPYQYTDPSGLFSASANLPTFSKPYANIAAGVGVNTGWMQKPLLSADLDVAALIANAAGFPIPLEGDLLGFGYDIFSLDAFAGVDLRQQIKFKPPALMTNYVFSSAVEVFDADSGTWGAPVTELVLADGQGVELRSAGAANIGVSTYPVLKYAIDYDADFVLKAGLDLSALEMHGFGISLGPLIDPDPWQVDLAGLDIASGTGTGKIAAKTGTLNLHFENMKYLPPAEEGGEPQLVDLCVVAGGCSQTGYVTTRVAIGDPDLGLVEETTRRVLNFGTPDCNDVVSTGCDPDPDFVPVVRQRRGFAVDPPQPWFDDSDLLARLVELGFALPAFDSPWFHDYGGDFAEDFQSLAAFLAAPPPALDRDSSDVLMTSALEQLGIDMNNPFPQRPPPTGLPYDALYTLAENRAGEITFGVPEPGTLALLITMLPFCGALRRRSPDNRLQ